MIKDARCYAICLTEEKDYIENNGIYAHKKIDYFTLLPK